MVHDHHHHQQQGGRGQTTIPNDRSHLGKPQVFVELSFGLSWSERHIPRSHNFSYTSKKLRNARDSGHFPRQQVPEHQQQHRHHADHERPRGRPSKARSHHFAPQSPPRRPRPDARRTPAQERGSSAPPLPPSDAWLVDDEGGTWATLFSRPTRATAKAPALWKDLPTDPASFRLGEGLPWSVSAWPLDVNNDEHEPPFANMPTVVPLSPLGCRRRGEDPQRVRDLASLSTAMMTVDNGFENQWWNQGERQRVAIPVPSQATSADEEVVRPMSMDDAALLSAAEPPSAAETYSANTESFGGLVSPISDFSPTFSAPRPFPRSFTSRSDDELWLGR